MRDLVRGKSGVGGASGVPPFLFPLGFPLGAKRKGSVVGGTQRAFSSRLAGAGSPGFAKTRWLRGGGGWSRSLGGGLGPRSCGGRPLGGCRGGLGAFSLSARPFSLVFPRKARSFRRRLRVFPANYRRLNGDEPVALSSQSSPFRRLLPAPPPAGRFSSAYTRVGAFAPSLGRRPWPRPATLRRFAARKFPALPASPLRPGEVRRFAVRKSDQTTRLSTSPLRPAKVPPKHPVFRFATSPLRPGEVSHFALAKFAASP